MKWHNKTKFEVMELLQTSKEGLTQDVRVERLARDGENVLASKAAQPLWKKVGKHFVDLLMLVLVVAGVLKGLTGSFVEMWIIFAVVIINGLIGYAQERKAEESLNGLKQMMSSNAVILSENVTQVVEASSLIVGDIVVLKSGDVVPADLRMLETFDLVIEEAVLTGESLPVEKQTDSLAEDIPLGDRNNMAFSGTLVLAGSGVGVVTATAAETEVGKINQALQSVQQQTTPLVRKMNQLNHQIFKGLITFILFLVFYTIFRFGMDLNMLLASAIALIVAVVPEGLPAVLTMILSMGVKEMADEQAIIKSMPAVESLGSMTVICSDKTGTLTKNQMEVRDLVLASQIGVDASSNNAAEGREADLAKLRLIMNNCQDLLRDPQQPLAELKGNPTELALLKYTAETEVAHLQQLDQIPFSSTYKYMATLHPASESSESQVIFVKGAPDVLLELAEMSSEEERSAWLAAADELARKGQRILGFAMKTVEPGQILSHENLSNLKMVGLAGLIDPPKESAIQAVAECQQAGIVVKMITGDHKETARAIGRQIGLAHTSNVLEGKDLDNMTDAELSEAVKQVDVFARTTPEHKLRIVTALQEQGEIVGMTGDGVNDAPALKKADIGVAMGIKGSEVTKQAADMVLADDNFATIAKAVKEGRRIFDNLMKTINFFLPTALAQGLVFILALMFNLPLPLTPVQILWVNMVSTLTLSYAFGFEPAHSQIMERSPRQPNEAILTKYAVFRILYVSLLITVPSYFLAMQFDSHVVQQTVLLQSIVLVQAFYMLNCRELLEPALNRSLFSNKAIFVSFACLAVLQMAVLSLPMMQGIIGTTHLTWIQHALIFTNGMIVFSVVEIEKYLTLRMKRQKEKKNVTSLQGE